MSATTSPGAAIFLNDEPRPLAAATTVAALLQELGLAERKGLAVAVNDTIVRRTEWPTHALASGDRVLVIRATQGG